MTGIVYGPVEVNTGEPVLPQWWGTVDRWTLACVFLLALIGLVMALAASPAIAGRNDLDPFYYFYRQAFFALLALASMVVVSIMSIDLLRRPLHPGIRGRNGCAGPAAVPRDRFRQGGDAVVLARVRIRSSHRNLQNPFSS